MPSTSFIMLMIVAVVVAVVTGGGMPLPASCLPSSSSSSGPFAVSKAASAKATMACLNRVAVDSGINIPAAEACLQDCPTVEAGAKKFMARIGVSEEMLTCLRATCGPLMAECAAQIGVKLAPMGDDASKEMMDFDPARELVAMFTRAQACGAGAKTCLKAAFGDILADPRKLVDSVMTAEESCLSTGWSSEEGDSQCEYDYHTLMASMVVDSCNMETRWTEGAVGCGIPEETVVMMKNMHMRMMLKMVE